MGREMRKIMKEGRRNNERERGNNEGGKKK